MTKIDHVVVLALENRSFDHMLGYLEHPNSDFDGLTQAAHYNLSWDGTTKIKTSSDAKYVLPVDPDHSHDSVMDQLAVDEQGKPRNEGFVYSYERKGRGLSIPRFGGLLGPIVEWYQKLTAGKAKPVENRGPLIMLSQAPENVPVLSTLALQFGVCTRWFSSVPGETWPNRNYMHAATSDGETNIDPRFYSNLTIFEQLEKAGCDWHIYYDDTPQIWAFHELWDSEERRANWFHISHFAEHVADGSLPSYSFIEPNHRPPFHLVDDAPTIDKGDGSNNQHPGNNLVHNDAYDTYHTTEPVDFVRGEALIARVYEALRTNPEVFNKTLLLITYDEHGGFYDHVPPPTDVPAPARKWTFAAMTNWLFHRKSKHFDFHMLGARVPAITVSPYVDKNTVITDVFDHSSIPATVRKLFAPALPPLTERDASANTFEFVCNLAEPRTDLPDLSRYAVGAPTPTDDEVDVAIMEQGDDTQMPEYYGDLVQLSDKVRRRMKRKGIADPAVARTDPGRLRAHRTTTAFRASAHRSREHD